MSDLDKEVLNAWWAEFQADHDEWRFADRQALLLAAFQYGKSKAIPDGWQLVPVEFNTDEKVIASLVEELASAEKLIESLRATVQTMAEGQQTVIAELKAHAERYRFLRARDPYTINMGGVFCGKTPENYILTGSDLDEAIDAAKLNSSPIPSTDTNANIDEYARDQMIRDSMADADYLANGGN